MLDWLNPKKAFERAVYKQATALYRKYEAASRGRRTSGWVSAHGPNTEGKDLSLIIGRSRDLAQNNGYGKKAIRVIKNNVVGKGIRPAPDAPTPAIDSQVKSMWSEWANSTDCDAGGKLNFYAMQRQIMASVAMSGGVLVRKVYDESMDFPLQLAIYEVDYIDRTKDQVKSEFGNEIIQGVEVNKYGKAVAYWLYPEHPTDGNGFILTSTRHDASEWIYVFNQDRPHQVHGVPESAATMLKLKDLDGYEDAQLMKQKVSACFTAFRSGSPDAASEVGVNPTDLERIEPGIIENLNPGETITFSNPPKVDNYSEYTKANLLTVAAGNSVTYEALTGDYSNVNFSSGRMGWLEFQRQVEDWQSNLINMFCQPVWKEFKRLLIVSKGRRFENVTVKWTPPRREMIDPVKEVNAMIKAIRGGVISHSDAVRQLGYDPDELFAEILKDFAKQADNSVILDSNPSQDAARLNKVVNPES